MDTCTDVALSSIYVKLTDQKDQSEWIRLIGVANGFSAAKKAAYADHLSAVWKAIESASTVKDTSSSSTKLCKGVKKDGSACANKAKDGSDYCGIHGK
jgi:hypothetical protein